MADPTWAEAWTQAKNRINLLYKTHLYCSNDSPDWLELEDTLVQSLEGEYIREVLASVAGDRARLSGMLTTENIAAAWAAHLLELARAAGIPEREPREIMPRLRDYMHANSYSLNSRNLTLGTPAAITGTGTGAIHRLTVSDDNYPLEEVFLEAKRAECKFDQGQVDKHEEVFEFRGVEAEPDYLNVLGSGMRVQLVALHSGGNSTGRFLTNSSFETFTGTAPTAGVPTTLTAATELTGWAVTTVANAAVELDTTYRGYPGEPDDLYSLRFTGNNTITQILNDNVRPQFNPDVPIYVQVAIYRASTVTGNVVLTFGGVSATVALGTLTDNAWNVVKIAIGANNWYKAFRADNMVLSIALNTYGGAGHIKIDDVIVGEYTNVDGTWYVAVGGATAFKQDDYSTWTDSLAGSEGVLQYMLFRAGLGSLPSNNGGTETVTDPS